MERNFNTPFGIANWAFLNKTKKYEGEDTGKYSVNLIVSGQDAIDLKAKMEEINEAKFRELKGKKLHAIKIKEHEDGSLEFTFDGTQKPLVTDSTGRKPLPSSILVGNGSKIRVQVGVGNFDHKVHGTGAKFFLNAVQVVELVEFQRTKFDAVEGGYEVAEEVDNDDIPFDTEESAPAPKQATKSSADKAKNFL